jgi:DNA-binding transcriptional regulator YiaG
MRTKSDSKKIAAELLNGCPDESLRDHQKIAAAILSGKNREEILNMPECDRWPETYVWLKGELKDLRELRQRVGLSMAEASRLTGTPYRTWQCWEDEGPSGRRPPGLAFAWLELYAKQRRPESP